MIQRFSQDTSNYVFDQDDAREEGRERIEKSGYGKTFIKRYWDQVDKLMPPYKNNIIEYAPGYIVLEKDGEYIQYSLLFTDTKRWDLGKPKALDKDGNITHYL